MDAPREFDEFDRLKKQAASQVREVRKLIQERDDLLKASSGSSGRQSVELSSKIREQLRKTKETEKKIQTLVVQEERGLSNAKVVYNLCVCVTNLPSTMFVLQSKGNSTQDSLDAHTELLDLVRKHIVECENLERRRYCSTVGRVAPVIEIRRTVEVNEHLDDIDPEVTP